MKYPYQETTKNLFENLPDEIKEKIVRGTLFDSCQTDGVPTCKKLQSVSQSFFKDYSDDGLWQKIYATVFPKKFKSLNEAENLSGWQKKFDDEFKNLQVEASNCDNDDLIANQMRHLIYHLICSGAEEVIKKLIDELSHSLIDKKGSVVWWFDNARMQGIFELLFRKAPPCLLRKFYHDIIQPRLGRVEDNGILETGGGSIYVSDILALCVGIENLNNLATLCWYGRYERVTDYLVNLEILEVYGKTVKCLMSSSGVILSSTIKKINFTIIMSYIGGLPTTSFKLMLEKFGQVLDLNFYDKDNGSLLSLACEKNDLEMVKYLLSKGADINRSVEDVRVVNPLFVAACEGHISLCLYLLKEGASLNLELKENGQYISVRALIREMDLPEVSEAIEAFENTKNLTI